MVDEAIHHKVCDKCGQPMFYDSYFNAHVCSNGRCGNTVRKRKTRYELIKSLSLDEMAEKFAAHMPCFHCPNYRDMPCKETGCIEAWKNLLNQEVADDEGDVEGSI